MNVFDFLLYRNTLEPTMPKVPNHLIRNGKVGVLISPGYGSGWSTWNRENAEELLFDPDLILAVENNTITETVKNKYPEAYTGGIQELEIRWVDQGEKFIVDEYDGAETLILLKDLPIFEA